jgi:diguanylate cyclase (GGDEF)-like protein
MTSTSVSSDAARQGALHLMAMLDTPPEPRFERLARLAAALFGVPIVLISLVDRERVWYKSHLGMDVSESDRSTFCGHAVDLGDMLIVPDATLDPRFAANRLVQGETRVRFYAGQPVFSADGYAVGALCLLDTVPRALSQSQRQHLRDLAHLVEEELNKGVPVREQQLATLALTDALTGLANRRSYELLFESAIRRAHRSGERLALMHLDVDRFRQICDSIGPAGGDQVLRQFAQRLIAAVRKTDTVCRLAGEEFVIVLEGVHTLDQCETIGHTILEAIRVPFEAGGEAWPVTTSIGIAWSAGGESGARRLADCANIALLQAKVAGGNRLSVVAQTE